MPAPGDSRNQRPDSDTYRRFMSTGNWVDQGPTGNADGGHTLVYQPPGSVPPSPSEIAGAFAPFQRDYAQESTDILRGQIELAPERFAAEAEFRPQYAQLDLGITKDVLTGEGGWLPYFEDEVLPYATRIDAASRTASREADVADVERLGPRVTEAFRSANPDAARILDLMSDQAYTDLSAGYGLTPEQTRTATQTARTAYDDRGMVFSNPAIAMEALSNDQYARQLYDERFRRAADVLGYEKSIYGDPMQAVLGRPSSNLGFATRQQGFASDYANAGPQIFNPESAYGSSLYAGNQSGMMNLYGTQFGGAMDRWNTLFNASKAEDIASENREGALWGAGIAAAGDIIGGWTSTF